MTKADFRFLIERLGCVEAEYTTMFSSASMANPTPAEINKKVEKEFPLIDKA